jgi:hypothetical protein
MEQVITITLKVDTDLDPDTMQVVGEHVRTAACIAMKQAIRVLPHNAAVTIETPAHKPL